MFYYLSTREHKRLNPSGRCLVSFDTENSGVGAMHQNFAQVRIHALAYTQQAGLASFGVLPGNKPEPGGKLSALAEGSSIANCRNDSGGDDRPDPWNLLPRLNVNQDGDLNRFATKIKDRLCNFSAHDLKNEILRVATASDAVQILSQMEAVLCGREHDSIESKEPPAPRNCLVLRTSSRICRRPWGHQRHDEAKS